jgi:hypothetical protein
MINQVHVIGGFSTERGRIPARGAMIRFTPLRMWVIDRGVAWACLAPEMILDHGGFDVQVTPTDTDPVPWKYLVDCPAGRYLIEVPGTQMIWSFKDLASAGSKIPM